MNIFLKERLIYLLMIIAIAVLTMMCYICVQVSDSTVFMLLAMILIILLLPLIRLYFVIDGGIQTIYEYYDRIAEKAAGMRVVPENVQPAKIFQRRKGVDRRWHDVPVKVERRRGERRKKKQDGPDKPDLDWDISESAEDDSWLRDDEGGGGSASGIGDLLE
ncbi:MAG: hypothetical protein II718_08275 [Clostridiales bacterium]|nr:hypothetical protein [Clostridiales bacterium]